MEHAGKYQQRCGCTHLRNAPGKIESGCKLHGGTHAAWACPEQVKVRREEGVSLQNPVWLWDRPSGAIHLIHTMQRGKKQVRPRLILIHTMQPPFRTALNVVYSAYDLC